MEAAKVTEGEMRRSEDQVVALAAAFFVISYGFDVPMIFL